MRRLRHLSLAIIVLGPCILAVGCSQGFGVHSREVAAVPGPADSSLTAPARQDKATPPNEAGNATVNNKPSSRSNPAKKQEKHLNLREVAESISTEGSEELAPLPAQFTQPQGSSPEVLPPPPGTPGKKQLSVPAPQSLPNGGELIEQLHFDGQDVRKALEIVSRQAKVNILVSPGVSGTITLDLQNKTLDETLRYLATLCNLSVRRDRDVIYVSTPAEVRQGEEDDLPVRVYRLNYVKSTDIESMVKPLLSDKGQMTTSPDSEIGMKSDASAVNIVGGGGGAVGSDLKAGGNSMAGGDIVVVQDYEERLRKVDRVIAQIDIQPVQVLIEAVIVSVTLAKDMDLGVNFAVLDASGKALEVIGNGAALNAATGFNPATVLTTGGKVVGGAASGFAEDGNGVKFGWVGGSTPAFIRALETRGETKVLAAPRLLVVNKQPAQIHIGDQLGYVTSSVSQTSTTQNVQFMNVGTQLLLRPYVSSDGMIRMEIHPERSTGHLEAGIPQGNTTQVTSNVMVPDGATIVIGGLIDEEVNQNWQGVPFLDRLPWLGYLFRHTEDKTTKKELVVLLTPHIWRPECPEALNYLGRPRSLGLQDRVSQRPCVEAKDGPSLLELVSPQPPCPVGPAVAPATDTTAPSLMGKASSPVRK
jgi:general secretion pathway protein D